MGSETGLGCWKARAKRCPNETYQERDSDLSGVGEPDGEACLLVVIAGKYGIRIRERR